jgi:hypothetical protein
MAGQWDIVRGAGRENVIADRIEFFDAGTALMEERGSALSFTWRMSADGRLFRPQQNKN